MGRGGVGSQEDAGGPEVANLEQHAGGGLSVRVAGGGSKADRDHGLFGWWDAVVLAEWGVLELMTNPYSDFTRGLSAVRGWYTCDVGVRYPAAFSYATTIT